MSFRLSLFKSVLVGMTIVLLAVTGGPVLAGEVADRLVGQYVSAVLGEDAAAGIFPDTDKMSGQYSIAPNKCAQTLEDIGAAGIAGGSEDSLTEGPAALALWGALSEADCKDLGFVIQTGDASEAILLFDDQDGDADVPAGIVAVSALAGDLGKTKLADMLATIPKADKMFGTDKLALDDAFVVFANADTELALEDLPPLELATRKGTGFDAFAAENLEGEKDNGDPSGTWQITAGVHAVASLERPSGTRIDDIVNAMPNGFTGEESWTFYAAMGVDFATALFGNIDGLADIAFDTAPDEQTAAFELPPFIPFPFNNVDENDSFYVVNQGTLIGFSSEEEASAIYYEAIDSYTLFGEEFDLGSVGKITVDGDDYSFELESELELDKPLEIGELAITKILAGNGLEASEPGDDTDEEDKASLPFGKEIGLTVSLGVGFELDGAFGTANMAVGLAKDGSKLKPESFFITLNGGDDGFALQDMRSLKDVPFLNEITLNEGVVGISGDSKSPNIFVKGGYSWETTGMGGDLAIFANNDDIYVVVKADAFTLAPLLPDTSEYAGARQALDVFHFPEGMLIMTNASEGGTLDSDDIPDPLEDMFSAFDADKSGIDLYGGGVSVLAKINLPEGKDENLEKSLEALGLQGLMADGGMIVAGSIGGFEKGKPGFSLGLQLPAISQLPDNTPLDLDKFIKPHAMSAFVAVETGADAPTFKVGLSGGLGVLAPNSNHEDGFDYMDLDGQVYASAGGAKAAVKIAGSLANWDQAFGIKGLYYDSMAVLGAVSQTGNVTGIELGIGGESTWYYGDKLSSAKREDKVTFAADFYIGGGVTPNPPFISPNAFALNLEASEISAEKSMLVADVLADGIINSPLSDVLTEMANLDANGKAAMAALKKEMAGGKRYSEAIGLDQLPIVSMNLKPADSSFFMPAVALDDDEDAESEGSDDRVRIGIISPGVEIPGRELTPGFTLNASFEMDVLGAKQPLGQALVSIDMSGIQISGSLPPIKGGGLVLTEALPEDFPTVDEDGRFSGWPDKQYGDDNRGPFFNMVAKIGEDPVFGYSSFIDFKDFNIRDANYIEMTADTTLIKGARNSENVSTVYWTIDGSDIDLRDWQDMQVEAAMTNDLHEIIQVAVDMPGFKDNEFLKPMRNFLNDFPVVYTQTTIQGRIGDYFNGEGLDITSFPSYFGAPTEKEPVRAKLIAAQGADLLNYAGAIKLLPPYLDGLKTAMVDGNHKIKGPDLLMGPLKINAGTITTEKLDPDSMEKTKDKDGVDFFRIDSGIELAGLKRRAVVHVNADRFAASFAEKFGDIGNMRMELDGPLEGYTMLKQATGQGDIAFRGTLDNRFEEALIKAILNEFGKGLPKEVRRNLETEIKKGIAFKVHRAVLSGSFIAHYGNGEPADLEMDVEILGNRQTVNVQIPGVEGRVVKKAFEDLGRELAKGFNAVAQELAKAAKTVGEIAGNSFNDLLGTGTVVKPNAYAGMYLRIRQHTRDRGQRVDADKCVENLGATHAVATFRINDCDKGYKSRNQLYQFEYQADGTSIRIRNKTSNMCLSGDGGNGARVIQYKCDNGPAQKWIFAETQDKTGRLINMHTKRCMDLDSGDTSIGNEILMWDCKRIGTLNQYFYIEEASTSQYKASRPVLVSAASHMMEIQMQAVHSSRCVQWTHRGLVQLGCQAPGRERHQLWRLEHRGGNGYQVRNMAINKCLDVDGYATNSGARVHLWDCKSHVDPTSANQIFHVEQDRKGNFNLKPQHAGGRQCLDVFGAGRGDWVQVGQGACNSGNNQRYRFILHH